MSQSIRVLIGDDSLELGISWATAFKEAGLYAITRPKMGKVLVDYDWQDYLKSMAFDDDAIEAV